MAVIAKWGRSANAALRLGVEGATGYSPTAIQRVRALLEATRSGRLEPLAPVTSDTNFPRPLPESSLWPLLATPLVVSDVPRLLPLLGEGEREWEDPFGAYSAAALPRVFWTGAWEERGDERMPDAIERAATGEIAYLAPPESSGGASAADGRSGHGGASRGYRGATPPDLDGPVAATEIAVERNRLDATVVAPAPGLAIVLDPWFPGWTATVDGAPAPVLRADFAFIGVPVPAGTHRLALTYRNVQVGRGALVALATTAALAFALGWRRRRSLARSA
jgi:hypothetical protein